jgi:RNA polymerase sigma-70 factor (ECF subfamily)
MTSQIRAEGASGEAEATRGADAFVTLATAQAQQSYRLAGMILRDAVEAQDAMQEALLRAWQAWPKLRESERFDPWFSQILVNVCRNRLRSRPPVRWMPLEDDLDGPTVADPFRAALARDELGKLVAGLSRDHQIVVALRFWADWPLAEIATRLDVPLGTVKSRLHNALGELRKELESQPEGSRT